MLILAGVGAPSKRGPINISACTLRLEKVVNPFQARRSHGASPALRLLRLRVIRLLFLPQVSMLIAFADTVAVRYFRREGLAGYVYQYKYASRSASSGLWLLCEEKRKNLRASLPCISCVLFQMERHGSVAARRTRTARLRVCESSAPAASAIRNVQNVAFLSRACVCTCP